MLLSSPPLRPSRLIGGDIIKSPCAWSWAAFVLIIDGLRLDGVARYHHASLGRLLGACPTGANVYLAYELPAGACTLAACLSSSSSRAGGGSSNTNTNTVLSTWLSRVQVAVDMAHGIEYAHAHADAMHGRVLPSSVLLVPDAGSSKGVRAVLTHFGAAHFADAQATEQPPSKAKGGKAGDVRAFGVLLLGLLAGVEGEQRGGAARVGVVARRRVAADHDLHRQCALPLSPPPPPLRHPFYPQVRLPLHGARAGRPRDALLQRLRPRRRRLRLQLPRMRLRPAPLPRHAPARPRRQRPRGQGRREALPAPQGRGGVPPVRPSRAELDLPEPLQELQPSCGVRHGQSTLMDMVVHVLDLAAGDAPSTSATRPR
ncbi:hypothetical protein ZWY2020_050635 [Hordeum vulgare]|nr:hypothetical protein ZWY2020_050635 [Hordeum vulgare]